MKTTFAKLAALIAVLMFATAWFIAPSVGVYWLTNVDPTVGAGMTAPSNQLAIRTDVPSLYYKSGTSATSWTKIGNGTSVTGLTCPAAQFFNAVTSAGVFTCTGPIQPNLGRKIIGVLESEGGTSTTLDNVGMPAPVAIGTATARSPTNTSLLTSTRRLGYVSAAGAGSLAGFRETVARFWIGNGAGLGGWQITYRFATSDAVIVATGRELIGLRATASAPTDVNPSTLVNILGVGCDNGDANLQAYGSGAVAQARVDLGASFPCNTTNVDLYELVMTCTPNASTVNYQLTRLNTGAITTGSWTGAQLPSNASFMMPQFWRGNGGTAAAVALDLAQAYFEMY